jgi:hypothetical protein
MIIYENNNYKNELNDIHLSLFMTRLRILNLYIFLLFPDSE